MRKYHQDKIRVGLECYARKGKKVVAIYKVIEILSLHSNPTVD